MGVHENLEILKKVQELDREIYTVRQELDSFPDQTRRLTEALEQEKNHLKSLEEKLKGIQLRQKQKEGELSEKETLIRKYDTQLTQVKTNKEYTALQKEIDALRADNSMIEDSILVIFDEIEKVQAEFRQERERLAQVEQESVVKKKELEQRAGTLKGGLEELIRKRAEVIGQVTPEAKELYEKIIAKKESVALVPVAGEVCGACRIQIRPQLLEELALKHSLVVCENCSRILYLA